MVSSKNKEESLAAYAQLYMKAEIQAEAVVRNLPAFARFLPIAALLNGQTLNASNIAREAGIARATVDSYLDILQETLLCFRVLPFESKLRVRERRHPKWYWCDPGLVRAIKHVSGPLTPEERGPLFEGLVAQLIRACMDYRAVCDECRTWAPTDSDVEVDFLLTKGRRHVAVEVKSGRTVQPHWLRGLRAIAPLPGLIRRILVYPEGPALILDSGVEVYSFAHFSDLLMTGKIFQ
ncbi:MAG: DUF4143 domain-containing protein [Elusimicrobia bacterium]|nr:DUF4143 domain-containing protein [Elusimicrobiota bacterium]